MRTTRLEKELDLLTMPDDELRHELVRGVIVAEPLPSPWHDHVRRRLGRRLEDFCAARRLGSVFWDTGFLLAQDPDTVRGPDLSFVRRDRLVGADYSRFIRGAPDLAVEILSPTNRAGKVRTKIADYLRAGSRLVWVIDPKRKTATVYRSLDRPLRVAPEASLEGEDVLPGFAIPLAVIFEGVDTP